MQDIRAVYGMETWPALVEMARGHLWKKGIPFNPSNVTAEFAAYVNHGRWIADCACGAGVLCGPWQLTVCLACGTVGTVRWPAERKAIEALLAVRPEANRNWYIGETVEQLAAENAAHLGGEG